MSSWSYSDARDGRTAGEVRVHVPLKQREISQLLAIAPAYLCVLISQLERDGLLRRESGAFILLRRRSHHTKDSTVPSPVRP